MARRGLVLALVVFALAAAPAGATIVLQRSIQGVSLGMTQTQVRRLFYIRPVVQRGRNSAGRYVKFYYPALEVTFQGGRRVTEVATTRRRERTRSGVGIGSSERAVRRLVRGVRCTATGFGTLRTCTLGRVARGRRVTTFFIRSARVYRISVEIVVA